MIRRESRITRQPDTDPPSLLCPFCSEPLVYVQTVCSGIQPEERWDWFQCGTCGEFEYRHRTRKLRRVER